MKQSFQLDNNQILAHFKIDVDTHIVKKNNRPIWRNRLGKSNKLLNAESTIRLNLLSQKNTLKIDKPFNQPLWCIFRFYFDRSKYFTKKGTINKKLGDLSNLIQLPEDELQKSGIIEDDSLIQSLDLSRRLPADKNWLEIIVLRYD